MPKKIKKDLDAHHIEITQYVDRKLNEYFGRLKSEVAETTLGVVEVRENNLAQFKKINSICAEL